MLTRREIANQERSTYVEQQRAETARIEVEKARGHGEHAGRAGHRPGVGRHQHQRGPGPRAGGHRRGGLRAAHRPGRGRPHPGASAWPRPRPPRPSGWPRPPATTPSARRSARWPRRAVAVASAIAEGQIDIMPEVLVTGGGGAVRGPGRHADAARSATGCPSAPPRPVGDREVVDTEGVEEELEPEVDADEVRAGAQPRGAVSAARRRRRGPPPPARGTRRGPAAGCGTSTAGRPCG